MTGAQALNNLLGREVYSSNLQLGGTQIMYRNGVSHMTANDDFAGIAKIVEWMSFVPEKRNAPLLISPGTDSWNRDVEFMPPQRQPFDVRWMIEGRDIDGTFESGLFDRDSFVESLGGWAKTVVVGRARLGGIPLGVIAVESRTVENVSPADPANPDSIEQIANEAGGVWYPNSAFKTAQAINDFNFGEQLPLMILANWRGFSGGQRDMYNEVLKYGSFIVDALVKYEQPIFVYVPPFGELRGGSWVVVDPTINPTFMEMYADEQARGGVLEPEGIVGIKYRREKQLETMARLDPEYAALKQQAASDLSKEEFDAVKAKMTQREKQLLPVYNQVALQFADLHDRAGRMKAKGVIRDSIQWSESRRFFYWRLRRRLNEEYLLRRMSNSVYSMTACSNAIPPNVAANRVAELRHANLRRLAAWTGIANFEHADKDVAVWYEDNRKAVADKIEAMRSQNFAAEICNVLSSNKRDGMVGVREMLRSMPLEEREQLIKFLQE